MCINFNHILNKILSIFCKFHLCFLEKNLLNINFNRFHFRENNFNCSLNKLFKCKYSNFISIKCIYRYLENIYKDNILNIIFSTDNSLIYMKYSLFKENEHLEVSNNLCKKMNNRNKLNFFHIVLVDKNLDYILQLEE